MPARNRLLPRGHAWPLTATDVTAALGPLTRYVVGGVRFLTVVSPERYVLGVAWVAPASRSYGGGVHPDSVGFRLDVLPVPAAERAAARALLREQGLAEAAQWVADTLTGDETRRWRSHSRYWQVVDGRLVQQDVRYG